MMPVVATFRRTAMEILAYTLVMVAITFVLAPVAHLGPLYLVAAAVLGAGFVALADPASGCRPPRRHRCSCSATRSRT